MWLEEDAEYALAWSADERERCDGCGQRRSETTGPGNYDRWQASLHACHACKERDRAHKQYESSGGDMRGLLIGVHDRGLDSQQSV